MSDSLSREELPQAVAVLHESDSPKNSPQIIDTAQYFCKVEVFFFLPVPLPLSPDGTYEAFKQAYKSTEPEDNNRIEYTTQLFHHMMLGSCDYFMQFLESLPEETLQKVWKQSGLPTSSEGMYQREMDFPPSESDMEESVFEATGVPGEYVVTEPVTVETLFAFTRSLLKQQFLASDVLAQPALTRKFLTLQLATRPYEVFASIFLDNRHQILAFEELFYGTLGECAVHPREVVKKALHHNAGAVIFAHNHPSGLPDPSDSDTYITNKLKDALALVDVRVLDHIVVGGAETVSFAEKGLI